MKIETKKSWKNLNPKKKQEVLVSSATSEKKVPDSSESNVSVFTKTTSPKVIIKSESLKHDYNYSLCQNRDKHRLLQLVCFMIMCVIILMTFFLSLKTYNVVKELSDYILL